MDKVVTYAIQWWDPWDDAWCDSGTAITDEGEAKAELEARRADAAGDGIRYRLVRRTVTEELVE